jgi:aryl-alcohol dehydrogenase-like predicted oxidoreductase
MESLWVSEKHGLERYVSLQPHYNLVHRAEFERELLAVVQAYGLGVISYSPLAGGFLTGKYGSTEPLPHSVRAERIQERYFGDRWFELLDRMAEIGRAHGQGILQVALAWLLTNPAITAPIVGANSVEQLQQSLEAVGFRLSSKEMGALDKLTDWQ